MCREQAQRALDHYFSPGNLTALRELALRRTAERVDEQMLSYMQAHAIAGPWAAGERVLVCVTSTRARPSWSATPGALADRLQARWIALYVETPRTPALSRSRARPHRRDAAAGRAARRRGRDAAGRARSPTRCSPMRAPTTSPRSSSASRSAPAGSSCCTARWSHELVRGGRRHQRPRHCRREQVELEPRRGATGCRTRAARAARPISRHAPTALATASACCSTGCRPAQHVAWSSSLPVLFVAVAATGCVPSLGRPRWRRSPTTSSSCRRSTPSPSRDPDNVVALFFFLLVARRRQPAGRAPRCAARGGAARGRARPPTLYAFSRKIAGVMAPRRPAVGRRHQIAPMLKARS